jgi:protein transport protein SEC13
VQVWSTSGSTWQLEGELKGHTDWVRDVSWAPSDGRLDFVIASAGQDGKVSATHRDISCWQGCKHQHLPRDLQVTVWTEEVSGPQAWKSTVIHAANVPIWRVSWSTTGSILAATEGSGQVSLWKQALDGAWQQL